MSYKALLITVASIDQDSRRLCSLPISPIQTPETGYDCIPESGSHSRAVTEHLLESFTSSRGGVLTIRPRGVKEDPFITLGLSKSTSDAEISSTYRKLSLKLHQDKKPDASAADHDRFVAVTRAYKSLTVPVQSARWMKSEDPDFSPLQSDTEAFTDKTAAERLGEQSTAWLLLANAAAKAGTSPSAGSPSPATSATSSASAASTSSAPSRAASACAPSRCSTPTSS